jgi:hypothetical protein
VFRKSLDEFARDLDQYLRRPELARGAGAAAAGGGP